MSAGVSRERYGVGVSVQGVALEVSWVKVMGGGGCWVRD